MRKAVPYLAYSFVSLVGWTSRIRFEGTEHLEEARRGGKGFIYAFWHQRQVFFTYTHRDEPAHVLVSRSRDGELIAETMRLSRIGAVRGSSSRGAAASTKAMVDLLRRGRAVGITPDGPKGPARQVKDGVLFLALQSGAPILPISNALSRRVELRKAWDRFHVPLPFSRAAVTYGPLLYVRSEDELPEARETLRRELDRITEAADRLVGG